MYFLEYLSDFLKVLWQTRSP